MWTTVLILALALNFEPNRLGVIGFLLLRAHPIRQLLVFLSTSFLVSALAGITVLFVVDRGSLLQSRSSSAVMQIVVGILALLAAAVLLLRGPAAPNQPRNGLVERVTARAGGLTRGGSTWVAAALGVGISLPSVDYIALLLMIAASGQSPRVQVSALFTFLIVANAILLVPVISYAVARQRTLRILETVRSWAVGRSRREYAALLTLAGAVMLTVGLRRL